MLYYIFAALTPANIGQTSETYLDESVRDYAKCLKATYRKKSAFPEREWPRTKAREPTKLMIIKHATHNERSRHLNSTSVNRGYMYNDTFARSELRGFTQSSSMKRDYLHDGIDSITSDKKEIDIARILDPVRPSGYPEEPLQAPKVLMDGAPGVGKTTLTRKACIDWANGSLFENYDLVLLIPLREARYRRAEEIKDFFVVGSDPNLKQNVISSIQNSQGKDVLLIFDGFDELSYEQREEESLFLDIIQGDQLPECSVLVTSRPYASDHLKQLSSINRHVEVLGFKREQIYNCIRRNISEESSAKNLIAELEKREDIQSLCYFPLLCVITVHLYEKSGALPATMTQLFHDFVLESVKRDIKVAERDAILARKVLEVTELNELPNSIARRLGALEKLSYESLAKDQFTFAYSDLQSCLTGGSGELDELVTSKCLGLITSLSNIDDSRDNQYQFFHLSVQEYLAARHVSKTFKTEEEQLDLLRKYVNEPRFRLFLLFYAGMTTITVENAKLLFHMCKQLLLTKTTSQDSEKGNLLFQRKLLYFVHMIYESCNFELFDTLRLFFCDMNILSLRRSVITLFDCMLLTYFFSSITYTWEKLDLRCCYLEVHSFQIFSQTYKKHKSKMTGKASFKSIDISQNYPAIVYHLDLFPWLSGVEEFIFECESKGELNFLEHPPDLRCLSHVPKLNIRLGSSMFDVSENDRLEIILSDSKVSLCYPAKIGEAHLDHVKELNIDRLILKDVDYKAFEYVETLLPKSFMVHNVFNMDIWLCQPNTISLLSQCKRLQQLSLHYDGFTTSSAVSLFTSLKCNSSIIAAEISGSFQNEYQYQEVGHSLEQMLLENTCIKSLQIGQLLNDELTKFLIAGLSKNTTLKTLKFDETHLTVDSIQGIISSSANCSSICDLYISKLNLYKCSDRPWILNTFASKVVSVKSFCAISQISQLRTCYASITEFCVPHYMYTLEDETLAVFTQTMQCNHFVKKLSIDSGFVTDKFRSYMLRKLLVVNRVIENLTIELSDVLCEDLAYALSKSTSLKSLTINMHSICSSSNLVCILKALQDNQSIEKLWVNHPNDHHLGMCVGLEFEKFLTDNSSLIELYLDHVNDDIAHGLAKGLLKNRVLKELIVHSLTSGGAAEILLSLNDTQQLQVLWTDRFMLIKSDAHCEWDLCVEGCSFWAHMQNVFNAKKERLKVRINKMELRNMIEGPVCIIKAFMNTILNIYRCLKVLNLSSMYTCKAFPGDISSVKLIGETFAELLTNSSTLEILNMHQSWVPGGIWKYASLGLKDNKSLKVLIVSKSQFSVDDIVYILESLQHNHTLEDLDISELKGVRKVNGPDCYKLNQAFRRILVSNSSIQSMNLKNSINDDIAGIITDTMHVNIGIRKLVLSEQFLSCESIHKFFMLLSQERALTIGFEIYFSELILRSTTNEDLCQCLTYKIFDGYFTERSTSIAGSWCYRLFCGLCYTVMRQNVHIPLLHHLKSIELKDVDSNMACIIFRTISNKMYLLKLIELSFISSKISGDEVGCQLKHMLVSDNTLIELRLSTIDDIAVECISEGLLKNTTLKRIYFDIEQLSEHIVTSLLQSITNNVGLTKLCIGGLPSIIRSATSSWYMESAEFQNSKDSYGHFVQFICILFHIGSHSTSLLTRGHAIESILESLSCLQLSSFNLDVHSATCLLQTLSTNCTCKKLDLSESKKLISGGNHKLSDALETMLSTNTKLEDLNLSGALNNMTAIGLVKGLKCNTTLIHLCVDGYTLRMKTITEMIDLVNTTNLISLTVKGIFVVRKCKSSQWQVDVKDERMWSLFSPLLNKASSSSQLLKAINTISTYYCHHMDDSPRFDIMRKHLNFKNLRAVSIRDGWIRYPQPKIPLIVDCNLLKSLEHLQIIVLSDCCISDNDCKDIATTLYQLRELKKLDLSHNRIYECGMTSIMNALHRRLEELDVSHNFLSNIGSNDDTPSQLGVAIQTLLSSTTSLKVFSIHHCSISSSLCEYIGLGLRSNKTLGCLDVSCNLIGIVGIRVLLESIENNCTLKKLDLSETGEILDEHDFRPALFQRNKTLSTLNFNCKFSGSSLMRFANELQHSTTLKSLTINIFDNDNQDIVSLLTCRACMNLDSLNCSEEFTLISTQFGRKMEIKTTNNLDAISQVIQSGDIELYEVVISSDSATDLELDFDDVWIKHIKSIFKSLSNNNKVTSLSVILDENYTQQCSILGEALKHLLKENKKIKSLFLFKCIDSSVAEGLMEGLSVNHSLEEISIDVNHLTDETICNIVLSIEFTNISKIVLYPTVSLSKTSTDEWKIIRYEDHTVNFLKFFCSSISLMRKSHIFSSIFFTLFDLTVNCAISETLAISVFNAFEQSPCLLRVLNLSGREFKGLSEGVSKALENKLMMTNFNLEHLKLDENINDSIAYAISRGLLLNRNFLALDFSTTCLSDDALSELLQSFCKTKLMIDCKPKFVRLVRVFSLLQQSVEFTDDEDDEASLVPSKQTLYSHVLGKIFHSMKSTSVQGLQELIIRSPRTFLSNELVKNGLQYLLKNFVSLNTITFCDAVTPEVIEGLSSGLRGNKTLSTLKINKKSLSWSDVSPILKSLHFSAVSILEFIRECLLCRISNGKCWTLRLTRFDIFNGLGHYDIDIYHGISKFSDIKIGLFDQEESFVVKLLLSAENAMLTNVLHRSIKAEAFSIHKLHLECCDDSSDLSEVVSDIEEILKCPSLKVCYVGSYTQPATKCFLKNILLIDFTNISLIQLHIGDEVSFSRGEEIEIASHNNSPWKLLITEKDILTSFYIFLSQINRVHCIKSSLCHLAMQLLRYLDLSCANLSYTDLGHLFSELKHDTNLTHLNLSDCRIIDMPKILTLDMQSDLLDLLKNSTTLREIDLTGIVNHELTKAIASALSCCSLKSLSINMLSRFDAIEELVCAFVSSGLNQLRFADVCLLLKDDGSWFIDLRDNQVHSSRQRDLFRSWSILFMLVTISKCVPSLNLSLGTQVNDGYQLQTFKMFFSSATKLCKNYDNDKCDSLTFFQSLSELQLEVTHKGISLFETVMKSLKFCKQLTKLCVVHHHTLPQKQLKDIYKSLLLSNSYIKEIRLIGSLPDVIVKGIADELPSNSILQTLTVSLELVSSNSIAYLLDSFHDSNLTCLNVTRCCSIYKTERKCCIVEVTEKNQLHCKLFCASTKTQTCCDTLQKALTPNNTLNLSGENIPVVHDLLESKALQDGTVTQLILTNIEPNLETIDLLLRNRNTLQRVELNNCYISDIECEHIANALIFNKVLKVLSLRSNYITACSVQKLFKSLVKNSILQELDLSLKINDFLIEKMEDSQIKFNIEVTPLLSKSLSILRLGRCDSLCECIAAGLSSKVTKLKFLSLEIKKADDVVTIFKSLVHNTSLEVLECTKSYVSSTAAGAAIQQMLHGI